jgi:GTP-binding protein
MPGLIQGAHLGKGLGIQFLRHIERTRVLVFLIESISEDPKRDYEILLNELASYNAALAKKPKIVALTKIDLFEEGSLKRLKKISFGKKIPVVRISSVSREGLQPLLEEMWRALNPK